MGFRWKPDSGFAASPNNLSTPYDASFDGRVLLTDVRESGDAQTAFWVEENGGNLIVLDPANLDAKYIVGTELSSEGTVVAGYVQFSNDDLATEAFVWSSATDLVRLGYAHETDKISAAEGISGDGQVVVGTSGRDPSAEWAFRWTESEGMTDLGTLPGFTTSAATAASFDGRVIVGGSFRAEFGEAFRWSQEEGLVGLGVFPGYDLSAASAVSADGAIIVGTNTSVSALSVPFIWSAEQGMRSLQQVLIEDYGLGAQLAGWQLYSADDLSADGRVIVGTGLSPRGESEAWRAVLVPEPPTTELLLPLSAMLVAFASGRSLVESWRTRLCGSLNRASARLV
jgi:probable HAF family extracellular repeat protein